MNYANLKPPDFAEDDSFKNWVLYPDQETDAFWMKWLKEHPHKIDDIEMARKLVWIASMDIGEEITEPAVSRIWDEIDNQTQEKTKIFPLNPLSWTMLAAASITIFAVSYIYNRNIENPRMIYKTSNGELRKVLLSDGSVVTLNANSELSFVKEWEGDEDREVWIKGEGFFNVAQKKTTDSKVKFIVHTPDIDVMVTGTEFNVDTRQNKTQVVLSEGSIDLSLVKNDQKSGMIRMKPGDLVDYSSSDQILSLSKLQDPSSAYSWKDNRWEFKATPLPEVCRLIEDTYGIPVNLVGDSLNNQFVTGSIPSDNLDDILTSLESILKLNISKADGKIIIKKTR